MIATQIIVTLGQFIAGHREAFSSLPVARPGRLTRPLHLRELQKVKIVSENKRRLTRRLTGVEA